MLANLILKNAHRRLPTALRASCWLKMIHPYHTSISRPFSTNIKSQESETKPTKPKEDSKIDLLIEDYKEEALASVSKTSEIETPKKKWKIPKPTELYSMAKEGVLHLWHGTKLLLYEVAISARLLWKLLKGNSLSRREHRQVILY